MTTEHVGVRRIVRTLAIIQYEAGGCGNRPDRHKGERTKTLLLSGAEYRRARAGTGSSPYDRYDPRDERKNGDHAEDDGATVWARSLSMRRGMMDVLWCGIHQSDGAGQNGHRKHLHRKM